MRTNLQDILDYVALGTIADIVPLLGENRIFVKYGIDILSKQLRPGVRALFEMAHIKQALRPSDITFKLAPRINAAGRLGDADVALSLLNTDNIIEAYDFANKLEDFNVRRQEKEQQIFQEARQQILDMDDKDTRYSFVVSGEGWHQGVIGIVASRLSREFNRPIIVLTIQGDEAHGSGRSIKSLNMVVTLHKCASFLERFGGHPMAVGVTLNKEHIPLFSEAFEESVRETLSRSDLIDFIEYDGLVTLRDFGSELFDMLPKIGPFGHSNQQPLFRVKNVQPERIFPAGENHTRGTVYDASGTQFEFIAFNKKIQMFPKNNWDIIVTPQLNTFFNPPRPQLQIIHINDEV
jgi:single-stranded-DNA-specific exonuclease